MVHDKQQPGAPCFGRVAGFFKEAAWVGAANCLIGVTASAQNSGSWAGL